MTMNRLFVHPVAMRRRLLRRELLFVCHHRGRGRFHLRSRHLSAVGCDAVSALERGCAYPFAHPLFAFLLNLRFPWDHRGALLPRIQGVWRFLFGGRYIVIHTIGRCLRRLLRRDTHGPCGGINYRQRCARWGGKHKMSHVPQPNSKPQDQQAAPHEGKLLRSPQTADQRKQLGFCVREMGYHVRVSLGVIPSIAKPEAST